MRSNISFYCCNVKNILRSSTSKNTVLCVVGPYTQVTALHVYTHRLQPCTCTHTGYSPARVHTQVTALHVYTHRLQPCTCHTVLCVVEPYRVCKQLAKVRSREQVTRAPTTFDPWPLDMRYTNIINNITKKSTLT